MNILIARNPQLSTVIDVLLPEQLQGTVCSCMWSVLSRPCICKNTGVNAINSRATPPSAEANINAVVNLEETASKERTLPDRISDAIANFVGTILFVGLHVAWFAFWVGINLGKFRFDPYPFSLLCMLVSLEGVLLSTFVLIKQNRMSQRADNRAHLDLQINMLAEQEITKLLQLQRLICKKLEIREAESDAEVRELSEVTAVGNLARELANKMPV